MKMSRLSGLKAYLAGTMEHSPDSGVAWRQSMAPLLEKLGVDVLDPTDRPTRLSFANSATEETQLLKNLRESQDFDRLTECVQEIVHQDLRMVDISDFLIVNVDSTVPSVGTVDEFVTASNQRKPIFLFCQQGLQKMPLWYWGRVGKDWTQTMHESMDDVLERLEKIAYCEDHELDSVISTKKWFFHQCQA